MTIPASYSESKRYVSATDALVDAIDLGLNTLAWKHEKINSVSFQGRRPMSFWSWGEIFTIVLDPSGVVTMRSVCSFPFQIVAWGKNQLNVTQFFHALDALTK